MFVSKRFMGFAGIGFLLVMFLYNFSPATIRNVSIVDFQFVPKADTVSLGDTVRWTNNATVTPHTSTSNTGVWNSGTLNPGESFSFDFTSPGSFPYHCIFHPSMTASIVVHTTDVKDETGKSGEPSEFILYQNYPNPFNHSTTIEFSLAHSGFASLIIYDCLGRKVKTLAEEKLSLGYKSVIWDGRNEAGEEVASGIYLYRIKVVNPTAGWAGDFCETRKLLLLK